VKSKAFFPDRTKNRTVHNHAGSFPLQDNPERCVEKDWDSPEDGTQPRQFPIRTQRKPPRDFAMANKFLHVFLCLLLPIGWGVAVHWVFSRFFPSVMFSNAPQESNHNSFHLNHLNHTMEDEKVKET
jgi:hypothetical protein